MTQNLTLTFGLQDMNPDDIFENKKFSQELEISNTSPILTRLPKGARAHSCSDNISEIDYLYLVKKEDRTACYEEIRQLYADRYPLGNDRYLSGGNHYHIFFSTHEEVKSLRDHGMHISPKIYEMIRSLPFYSKFYRNSDGKPMFISRRNWGHGMHGYIGSSKSIGLVAKTGYSSSSSTDKDGNSVQSIEFRMNSNIDHRIYGLYQAALLYSVDESEGVVQTLSGVQQNQIYNGVQFQYERTDADEFGNITLEKIANDGHGVILTQTDITKIKHNFNLALTLLRKYGLVNSADALDQYVGEIGIFPII